VKKILSEFFVFWKINDIFVTSKEKRDSRRVLGVIDLELQSNQKW
jgi:hypothetical protein